MRAFDCNNCEYNTRSSQHECCSGTPPIQNAITAASPDSLHCDVKNCHSNTADIQNDRPSGTQRLRWQISGMDCPSCARKIEAAALQIEGVSYAQVLYSTQKLVVETTQNVAKQIEQALAAAGYTLTREGMRASAQTTSFWHNNALLITMVALLICSSILNYSNAVAGQIAFSLTTVIGVIPIARKAWISLRSGEPFTIELLMTVAAAGALLIGAIAESAMVLFLFMIGERLEALAAANARRGVTALMTLKPDTAIRRQQEVHEPVAVSDLQPGDIIIIPPGGRLPTDGKLLTPHASV